MKLSHVIIYVEDVKQTLAFYQAAFGLEIKMVFEEDGHCDYGELDTGGAALGFATIELGKTNLPAGFKPLSREGLPIGQEVVFEEEDVAAAYEKAVSAGAEGLVKPMEKPWGQTVAYVRALEGTLIELCSPMPG